ncbi:hypothetical protein ACFOU2_12240 [Bacillus songklensis]|uniref:Hydrolase n=1 Tax=Bacillus songklensis TaxID=1069116 RepID=A0ABV8B1W5_9BACI
MLKKLCVIFLACFVFLDLRVVQASKIENIEFELGEDEAVLTFFHLSKGEAALLQDGFGHSILINTGHAASKREVLAMLDLFQVKKLDAIIVTRQEAGYNDNIRPLSERFSPEVIYVPALYTGALPPVQIVEWDKGDHKLFGKALMITALREEKEPVPSMNLSIKYCENHIFYMTNYSAYTEQHLLEEKLEDVNVIKMPSLSKGDRLEEKVVEHLDPQTAIFPASNEYHLNKQFIEYLYELWIDIYFVQKMGTVSMKMNETHYEIITLPAPEGK